MAGEASGSYFMTLYPYKNIEADLRQVHFSELDQDVFSYLRSPAAGIGLGVGRTPVMAEGLRAVTSTQGSDT